MGVSIVEAKQSRELRDRFIEENLGLVRSTIKMMGHSTYNEDYFQEGCIGLIKAVDSYDLNYGVEFSTYAVHAIKGAISMYWRDFEFDNMTGARLPRKIKDINRGLKKMFESGASDEEICAKYHMSKKMLKLSKIALNNQNHCTSLNTNITNITSERTTKDTELIEILTFGRTIEDAILNKVYLDDIYEIVAKKMGERNSKILRMKVQGLNQAEIGEVFGISQVQVSRILKNIGNLICTAQLKKCEYAF